MACRMIQPQRLMQWAANLNAAIVRVHALPTQDKAWYPKLHTLGRINHIRHGLLAQSARCCSGCAVSTVCAGGLRADPYNRWRNLLP